MFELKGLEDSLGNTHLFYRYGFDYASLIPECWSKSIYHFDLNSKLDTLFIEDVANIHPFEGCQGTSIFDYKFFNKNPAKYLFGGVSISVDPVPVMVRYDGVIHLQTFGGVTNIEISRQDDEQLYASLDGGQLFRSIDGGYNWTINFDSLAWIDYAMISLSKNNDSQIYGINDNKLVRSENEGYSYIIVDDSQWDNNSELYYDPDGEHIYGVSNYYNFPTQSYLSSIYVSGENGNPFTWTNVITQNLPISFTHDETQSGEVYYSYQRNIYKSIDYGNTFELYKQLDRNITGLYKKSGTDILYASTPLKIYDITTNIIKVIKNLPIPASEFKWYPMNLGNRWIYDKTFYGNGDSLNWVSIVKVEGNKLCDNKFYSEVLVKDIGLDSLSSSSTHYEYFRIDSSTGKIYSAWFDNDSLLYEELYSDLLAEVGDTIPIGNGIYLESEVPFSLLGLSSLKRTFLNDQTPIQDIRFLKGLGLIYEYWWELAGFEKSLLGCIIDGVVYGDTTVVSVNEEELPVASTFKLEQNYPNPFNPSTIIKYEIPGQARNDNMTVVLKIYDVLGNEIATLINEEKPAGTYEVEFDGGGLPSGIYFYHITAGGYSATKKMILMK
ncbi:MAG: T9SS type A sorting domain-containing protein [Ignavibacteriaceae bacterium]